MQAFVILAVVVIIIISSAKKNQQQAQQQRAQQLARQRQANQYLDAQQGGAAPSGQKLDAAQQQALKERLQAAQRQRQAAQMSAPAAPMRPTVPQPPPTMTHRMAKQPFSPAQNAATDAARWAQERHYQGTGSLEEGDCAPDAHLPQSTEGVGVPSQMGPATPQGRPVRPSDHLSSVAPAAAAPVYDAARLREAIVAMEVFGAPRSRKKWQPR